MLGVALIATAFFRLDWQVGVISGGVIILFGAIFHGLSLLSNKKREK